MSGIVSEKFLEWTKGLDPVQSRIRIFRNIRDIPYAVVPELIDHKKGPSGILSLNKGSCSPKHFLLGEMFRMLNIPVKYASFPFLWSSFEVPYPPDIKEMLYRLPPDYHLACKAYIEERWILVDATWDIFLKKAGFPVAETWDGIHDTPLAVTPLEEVMHGTCGERSVFVREKESLYTREEVENYRIFIDELNKWFEQMRGS